MIAKLNWENIWWYKNARAIKLKTNASKQSKWAEWIILQMGKIQRTNYKRKWFSLSRKELKSWAQCWGVRYSHHRLYLKISSSRASWAELIIIPYVFELIFYCMHSFCEPKRKCGLLLFLLHNIICLALCTVYFVQASFIATDILKGINA